MGLTPRHSQPCLWMNCHHEYFDTWTGNNKAVLRKSLEQKPVIKWAMIHWCGGLFWTLFFVLFFVSFFLYVPWPVCLCIPTPHFRGSVLAEVKPPTLWRERGNSYLETFRYGTETTRHNTDRAQPGSRELYGVFHPIPDPACSPIHFLNNWPFVKTLVLNSDCSIINKKEWNKYLFSLYKSEIQV